MQNEINVEEIMEDIRRDIKERGLKEEDLKFSSIPIPTIDTTPEKVKFIDRIRTYAYYGVFIKTPKGFQRFVRKVLGKEDRG